MNSQTTDKKNERSLVKITLGFALVIFAFVYAINKYYINKNDFIKPIIEAKASQINQIVISAENKLKSDYNLVSSSKIIDSSQTTSEIIAALNDAKPYSASHPKPKWLCVLTLKTGESQYRCKIYNSTNQGVLIGFYSHGYWGLNLGTYRSDTLGPILEKFSDNIEKLK